MQVSREDIFGFEKRYRTNFINSIQGFKSANLIATKSKEGHSNLAIFSSLIHVGANPPLVGFVSRPTEIERHTYQNIKATERFTVNAVNKDIKAKAHATAARYPSGESEFIASGLTEEYIEGFETPFVLESKLKFACRLVDDILILANNTRFLVGEIQMVLCPDDLPAIDGYINPAKIDSVAISGLDGYHEVGEPLRFEYAKPNVPVEEL